jgi:hypothetical protein
MSRKIGKLLAGAAAYVAAYTPAGFWSSSGAPVVITGPFPVDFRYLGPDFNPWGWPDQRAWEWSPAWNTVVSNDANGRLLAAISGEAMP